MRISRTTLVLLAANLIAFALVWQATYAHRPVTVTPDLVFPVAGAKIEIGDEGRHSR